MLEEINISNLGIIDKASLPFTKGLTVITGETGAGKTMVLSALHMLLGKRTKSSMLRNPEKALSVEGVWSIDNESLIKDSIEETGAIIEDGQIFINRTIKNEGKSRAVIGGKTTPASVLSSIGEKLVNIHGQSDQVRLKNTNAQRDALDKFAGEEIDKVHQEYIEIFRNWKKLEKKIENIKNNSASRKREINSLKRFIEEYERIDPQENEDIELSEKIDSLSNIDAIKTAVVEAYSIASPENDEMIGIRELLNDVSRRVSSVSGYDKELVKIEDKLNILSNDADDLLNELEGYIDSLDEDSIETLYLAQEREIELKNFVKKYGNSLDEVIAQYVSAAKDLKELEEDDQPIENLEFELAELLKNLTKKADELSELRKVSAQKMEKLVDKELKGLSMSGSSFQVFIKQVPFSLSGQDEVEFKLSAKGSKESLPIAKSASGGELSRIMLALEVVLADTENTGTFVFDEVDSGIGGKTAIEIGKRLSQLSQEAQVIVVTHLPQVAAYADNFLKVIKTETEDDVETSVEQLDEEGITNELTRMLSGMSESKSGQSHARELLEHACQFKNLKNN